MLRVAFVLRSTDVHPEFFWFVSSHSFFFPYIASCNHLRTGGPRSGTGSWALPPATIWTSDRLKFDGDAAAVCADDAEHVADVDADDCDDDDVDDAGDDEGDDDADACDDDDDDDDDDDVVDDVSMLAKQRCPPLPLLHDKR